MWTRQRFGGAVAAVTGDLVAVAPTCAAHARAVAARLQRPRWRSVVRMAARRILVRCDGQSTGRWTRPEPGQSLHWLAHCGPRTPFDPAHLRWQLHRSGSCETTARPWPTETRHESHAGSA